MKVGWATICLVLVGCPSPPRQPSTPRATRRPSAILFVTADLQGQLVPCGCSEGMRGGLAKIATLVSEARKETKVVLFADGPDGLFTESTLTDMRRPQELRKAQTIAQALQRIGVVAKGVGELDLSAGAEALSGLGLPLLPSGAFVLREQVAFAAGDDAEALVRAAARAEAAGARFVVGLSHAPPGPLQPGPLPRSLRVLVASHRGKASGLPSALLRGDLPVALLETRGRAVLRVDLFLADDDPSVPVLAPASEERRGAISALDERILELTAQLNVPDASEALKAAKRTKVAELIHRREALSAAPAPAPPSGNHFSIRIIPVETSLPDDSQAMALVEAYDRDVARMNQEVAARLTCPTPSEDSPAMVGTQTCGGCHPAALTFWRSTKHARAYRTLEERSKQFHLDCVGCHVTGMGQPGGPCRVDQVGELSDVGCESCHGAGSLHVRTPSRKNIGRGNSARECVGCHDAENSPHFDLAGYLPHVLGPGHRAKHSGQAKGR